MNKPSNNDIHHRYRLDINDMYMSPSFRLWFSVRNFNKYFLKLKLRSHRANGRETDKKSFYPFVSGRIRFMSVSNPVNPFLVR